MNDTPTTDWQTWTALAVVALTVFIFTIGIIRRRKKNTNSSACHTDCGCGKSDLKTQAPTQPQ